MQFYLIEIGEITSEQEFCKRFPVIFFHRSTQVREYLSSVASRDWEPRPIHVRINYRPTGVGKTTEAIVSINVIFFQ